MSKFLHNDEDKAIAIPRFFSENSRAKKETIASLPLKECSTFLSKIVACDHGFSRGTIP